MKRNRWGEGVRSHPHIRRGTMAELEEARVKLAKQDRKEANELLVAVGKQDEARVRRLLGIGHDPDGSESATRPSGVQGMKDGDSALRLALRLGNLVIARLLLVAGATVDVAMGTSSFQIVKTAFSRDAPRPRVRAAPELAQPAARLAYRHHHRVNPSPASMLEEYNCVG